MPEEALLQYIGNKLFLYEDICQKSLAQLSIESELVRELNLNKGQIDHIMSEIAFSFDIKRSDQFSFNPPIKLKCILETLIKNSNESPSLKEKLFKFSQPTM